jgi:hypothetical protein
MMMLKFYKGVFLMPDENVIKPLIPVERLIKAYIKMRDAKSEIAARHKEELAKINGKMERIGIALKERAIDQGTKGFNTEEGTASVVEKPKVSCSDWTAFTDFLKDKNPIDFLDKKVRTSAITQYMEETKGELPPGINMFVESDIRITRPKKK